MIRHRKGKILKKNLRKTMKAFITAGILSCTLSFTAAAAEPAGPGFDDAKALTLVCQSDNEMVLENETPSYSEDDLWLMAHLLAGEMQGCPDIDQLYTGSVVLNRVASPGFPNTIREVIFQRGQYQCTWDGNFYREPTDRNWTNARKLLEGGSVLPNAIFQASTKLGKHVVAHTSNAWYTY